MKDEEMAEEYANNIDYTKTVKIFDYVPYHENCDVADMVAQAFLAGLKAGRPQWHKVADGDYPDTDRTLEFIKPLLVEGNYRVSVRAFYEEFPRLIDYFEVTVEEIEE